MTDMPAPVEGMSLIVWLNRLLGLFYFFLEDLYVPELDIRFFLIVPASVNL